MLIYCSSDSCIWILGKHGVLHRILGEYGVIHIYSMLVCSSVNDVTENID